MYSPSISRHDQLTKLRERRRKKREIKIKILETMFVAVLVIGAITYILPEFPGSHSHSDSNDFYESHSRTLLDDEPTTTVAGYPKDVFTQKQIKGGAWLLYLMGMMYTFIAIALVCDEWFVPAIEEIVEVMDMTPDTAGATWMAAGGSAPELFTNIIAVFIAKSQMGFGTIVGSAVFNVLFVIGCCAIATPGTLPLTWWPFARDCLYYIISLSVLAYFYSDDKIKWWEAMILLLMYCGYTGIMKINQRLYLWVQSKLNAKKSGDNSGDDTPRGSAQGQENGAKEHEVSDSGGDDGKVKVMKTGNSSTGDLSPAAGRQSTAGVHFHASFYDFMTKDSTMAEQMGVHVVARMKGETKETFDSIDTDKNGHIDREELRQVLTSLGEQFNDNDLVSCFSEIDENGDGKISFLEFERWYLASKIRMTSDIKKIFDQFDTNGDHHIDSKELKNLLETTNEELDQQLSQQQVEEAMEAMGKSMRDKISESEFVTWYSSTDYFEKKTLKRQETLKEVEDEEGNGIEIEFPDKTCPRIGFIITAPIMYALYYTLPDVQKESKKRLWPLTFIGSMIWLMFFSYLMVWWATRVAQGWGMTDTLMGLTLVAAGTSVPDLLSSVIVAKLGQGDMAVSSSIGSNIFDILIGLPGPWIVYAFINGGEYGVEAGSLFVSLLLLMVMLIAVLICIIWNGWKLTHKLGWSMFVLYVVFVAYQVLADNTCCTILGTFI